VFAGQVVASLPENFALLVLVAPARPAWTGHVLVRLLLVAAVLLALTAQASAARVVSVTQWEQEQRDRVVQQVANAKA
jgi:hypothetical protein